MLKWYADYDLAHFSWAMFCTLALVATLLPGLMLLCAAASGRPAVWRQLAQWVPILCVCCLVWLLLVFSLAFGPGPIRYEQAAPMSDNVDLRDMLNDEVDPRTVIDDVGRGGPIGGLAFAGMAGMTSEGDPRRPNFAARRPDYRLPLSMFCVYQTAVFIAVVAGVGVLVHPFLTWPRTLAFLLLWSAGVYAPMAHWVWGDGWLALSGAIDVGGGLLHLTIAMTAVAAMTIGVRRHPPPLSSASAGGPEVIAAEPSTHLTLACGCFLVAAAQLVLTASFSVYVTQVPLRALGVLNLLLAGAAGGLIWPLMSAKSWNGISLQAGAFGLLAGCCSLAGSGALLTPYSALIVGGVAAAAGCACLGSQDGALPSAGRVLLAVQGVPAAIGLIVPGLLGLSSIGMKRLDGSVVTSLIDAEPAQLVLQINAVGSVALLVFAGTSLLLLALRIGLAGTATTAEPRQSGFSG